MNMNAALPPVGSRKIYLLALVLGAVLAGQAPARAQNFVNGSFETGDWTGWTHGASAYVDYPGSDGPWAYGYDGNHWVWLGNYDYASSATDPVIQQTVSGFTVGGTYTLSFLQSSEAGWYPVQGGNNELTFVDIIGAGTLSQAFTSPPSDGNDLAHGRGLWNVWQPETWTFVADSSSLTFKLAGNYGGIGDTAVDDFKITPNRSVPDGGATLALLGIAMGGLASVRRKLVG